MSRPVHPLLQGSKQKKPTACTAAAISNREFQKLWDDESISTQEIVRRLGYEYPPAAYNRAASCRKAGLMMIYRRTKELITEKKTRTSPAYTEAQGLEIVRRTLEDGLTR